MTPVEAAKLAASTAWQCPVAEIVTADLTNRFPWVHRHSLILVQQRGQCTMYVAVDRQGKTVLFPKQTDPLANLEALNGLLKRESVQLPADTEPEVLAQRTRTLLLGAGGFVGSSGFWASQKPNLQHWTLPSPGDGAELFQRYCRDPEPRQSSDEWTLRFSYFNNQGGVESWNLAGDTGRIREATFSLAVPNGTFMFPYC